MDSNLGLVDRARIRNLHLRIPAVFRVTPPAQICETGLTV